MGQGASGLPGAPGGPPGGPGGNKGKDDQKKKKKFEPRPPMRTGKKKRKKGPSAAVRTPQGELDLHFKLNYCSDLQEVTHSSPCRVSRVSNSPPLPDDHSTMRSASSLLNR